MSKVEFTGATRYRVETRLFRHSLLVLQCEVTGYVPKLDGGTVDGDIETWWVDVKPEWLLDSRFREQMNEPSK